MKKLKEDHNPTQQLTLDSSKAEFLSMISHELRTPMNVLLGLVEVLDKQVGSKHKELTEMIFSSGVNLLSVLDDILDYYEMADGDLEMNHKGYDLYKLMGDITGGLQFQVRDKNADLFVEYDRDTPHQLTGDPRRMRQVLVTLLNNSIKFTEEGYIKVFTSFADDRPKETYLKIIIEDSGRDLSQGSKSDGDGREYQMAGTELRLRICQRLVSAMGGDLIIGSTKAGGTQYCLYVPYIACREQLAANDQANNGLSSWFSSNSNALKGKVLLIEDNHMNQLAVKMMLEDLGCQVETASNGERGLQMFDDNDYDLVLTDIGLPGMDGIAVTEKIRQGQAKKAATPVIALTAHALEKDRNHYLNSGASAIITKPVLQGQLRDVIVKWVKQ